MDFDRGLGPTEYDGQTNPGKIFRKDLVLNSSARETGYFLAHRPDYARHRIRAPSPNCGARTPLPNETGLAVGGVLKWMVLRGPQDHLVNLFYGLKSILTQARLVPSYTLSAPFL